ncbi:MAG TPA: hypothetical protein VFR24_25010 [Candidatus Angelobacter sp.]|nr:hypothetical protein [Candidatus Angelobacter sp.]
MNKTHCTSWRGQNVRVLIVAAFMFAILSALPLKGRDKNSNGAAANLRIRVHIVRATFHHHEPKHEFREHGDVVFSIPEDGLKAEVIEEERLLSEKDSRALLGGKSGTVVLKTQTIVLP